jgi:hypothetical protein
MLWGTLCSVTTRTSWSKATRAANLWRSVRTTLTILLPQIRYVWYPTTLYLSPSSSAVQFRVVAGIANRFWLILYPREDCLQFEIVWRGRVPITNTSNFALNVSNANDTVSFRSAQRGRFITGLTPQRLYWGWIDGSLTGNQMARFGLFDDTDGFIFEIKNNSFNLVVQRGGVETARIDRLNFNADQLDGQGPSGVVIDLIKAIFSPLGFLDTRCRFICGRRIWETENRRTSFYILITLRI